jgi:hypothetical protein
MCGYSLEGAFACLLDVLLIAVADPKKKVSCVLVFETNWYSKRVQEVVAGVK